MENIGQKEQSIKRVLTKESRVLRGLTSERKRRILRVLTNKSRVSTKESLVFSITWAGMNIWGQVTGASSALSSSPTRPEMGEWLGCHETPTLNCKHK